MQIKSENYFKEYLRNIPNDQLIQFYDDLEWTPFPVLVLKEYKNRFKTKNKNEVLQKLKIHTETAREKTKKLTRQINELRTISSEKNLRILEKLSELNTKGIITNKEFQSKKKEILKRI